MKRLITAAGAGAALLLVAPPVAAQDMSAPPPSQTQTITGTVVDMACKFTSGLSGDSHRMCAQVCADKGLPLVILGSDGQVYVPVGEGMPAQPQNARLKEFAEQRVRITGDVFEAAGAKMIRVKQVQRA